MSDEAINKTSKGYIMEAIETIADLESSIDHYFDFSEDNLLDNINTISILSQMRQRMISTLSSDYDIEYHCIFKHLVRVYGRMKEQIISEKRKGNEQTIAELLNIFVVIRDNLYDVIKKYLKLGDEFDILCPKCNDDRLKKESK